MISSIRHRIEKLEALNTRLVKRMIWEDGSGSAEREIARLEAAGKLESVQLYIVYWSDDASVAAANELMRKRRCTPVPRSGVGLKNGHSRC